MTQGLLCCKIEFIHILIYRAIGRLQGRHSIKAGYRIFHNAHRSCDEKNENAVVFKLFEYCINFYLFLPRSVFGKTQQLLYR